MTSSRALLTSATFSFGMIRSSMPIDRPDLRRVGEAEVLERVEHLDGLLEPELQIAALHQLLQPLLLEQAVDERHARRNLLVQDHAADRRVDDLVAHRLHLGVQHVLIVARRGQILQIAGVAQTNRRQRLELARLHRQHHVVGVAEGAALAACAALRLRQVVAAEHDVLRRNRDRRAVRRREDVVAREHQHRRLDLRLGRQRNVNRHLVAVEVGVERRADERMDADRLALDQHRLERLDPQPVKRRRAVQQDRMLANHFLENVPDLRPLQLDHLLRLLDGGDQLPLFELVVDERLEQLERHLLRQPALMQLQLRPDDDDRTARVIDALAEQVLAEASLLALQGVGQRLQRSIVGATQHPSAAAVVEQRVDGLLQHALLVADDDVRRLQLHQLLQPVVPVDDAAIEVVQIRGREAAAVERHQRTQLRRNDRNDVENHPLRTVARLAERVDDLQPLGELQLLLRRDFGAHLVAQLDREPVDADPLQQLLDRLGAHLRLEAVLVLLARLPELLFVQQLVLLQLGLTSSPVNTSNSTAPGQTTSSGILSHPPAPYSYKYTASLSSSSPNTGIPPPVNNTSGSPVSATSGSFSLSVVPSSSVSELTITVTIPSSSVVPSESTIPLSSTSTSTLTETETISISIVPTGPSSTSESPGTGSTSPVSPASSSTVSQSSSSAPRKGSITTSTESLTGTETVHSYSPYTPVLTTGVSPVASSSSLASPGTTGSSAAPSSGFTTSVIATNTPYYYRYPATYGTPPQKYEDTDNASPDWWFSNWFKHRGDGN